MSKVLSVKKYINQNPDADLGKLFSNYRLDLESVLIGAILLNLEYQDILKQYQDQQLKNINESEYVEKIEEFVVESNLFKTIIPQNVKTAFLILLYLEDLKKESKEIISLIKKEKGYLSQIKEENIFDREIVFFTTKINLREQSLINLVRGKVKDLEVSFVEPAFKEFISHFDLIDFIDFDPTSEEEFTNIINNNLQDAIFPALIHQKAVITDNSFLILYDNTYLEHSILGLNNDVDLKQVGSVFIKNFTDDVKDELVESGMKYLITQSWGFGLLDLSVKAVKSFFISLAQVESSLSERAVMEDFAQFQSSGKKDIKEWFISDKMDDFKKALSSTGLPDTLTVSPKIFENYYQKFIERYFVLYGLIFNAKDIPNDDHTLLFTQVYDNMFNYNIRNNSQI